VSWIIKVLTRPRLHMGTFLPVIPAESPAGRPATWSAGDVGMSAFS
jgi:hypothetical protein